MKKKENGKHELIIIDDGIGFQEKVDLEKTSSLGLRIIHNLVQQLEGEIKIDSGPQGTKVFISF